MIQIADWVARANYELTSAQVLLAGGQIDSVVIPCRFAVEMILKACIAQNSGWPEIPDTNAEWDQSNASGQKMYASIKTHNLDHLLKDSQKEHLIRPQYLPEWSYVVQWEVAARYRPINRVTYRDAEDTLLSATILVSVLWP